MASDGLWPEPCRPAPAMPWKARSDNDLSLILLPGTVAVADAAENVGPGSLCPRGPKTPSRRRAVDALGPDFCERSNCCSPPSFKGPEIFLVSTIYCAQL